MQVECYMVRAILRQNEFLLRRHLVLSSTVLDKMRASGVITDVLRRRIVGAPAVRQVEILLESLEDRGLHSLQKFLEVLKSTGHSWMVDVILDTDVAAAGQTFAEQESQNQQALSVLRQEAVAIRQLLEQNARDEANVRRKQAAVSDITSRLRDIHHRAREVCQPAPHPNIGRYRLAQLNQIPWSIDN
ncbi:hypothetical protein EGW08_011927 [Elysia chlorotica]|uniref:CARD domain-containing protein n=1 Tax=Elysia chlorotica TaxID=188477 RepID=A0A3S1BCI0_ELYCH|nr:hypothetical protein EGW08_011927 [Elysia chlorotica]